MNTNSIRVALLLKTVTKRNWREKRALLTHQINNDLRAIKALQNSILIKDTAIDKINERYLNGNS